MRVGVLTGGGDCPGLNAVIRAIVRRGVKEFGYEFIGFRDGWRGPLEGDTVPLDVQAVRGILPRGGTILGSSRTNPLADSASSVVWAAGENTLPRVANRNAVARSGSLSIQNWLAARGSAHAISSVSDSVDGSTSASTASASRPRPCHASA